MEQHSEGVTLNDEINTPQKPNFEPFSATSTRSNIPICTEIDQLLTPVSSTLGNPRYDKRFKYDKCATNKTSFPCLEYVQCDCEPFCARFDVFEHGLNVLLTNNDLNAKAINNLFGSAKANCCMKGGSHFFEVKVVRPQVRLGIGRRESSCESIVGCNPYSYGISASNGKKVHCGRLTNFMEPLQAGDVVGVHVHLPISPLPKRVTRTRIAVKVGDQLWFESLNYRTSHDLLMWESQQDLPELKPEEAIMGSFMDIYRNGVYAGRVANNLRDFRPPHSEYNPLLKLPISDDGLLGYFPMVSVFGEGEAELNCGPNFCYDIPEGAVGVCELYDEQIADDFLMDLMEEVVMEEVDRSLPELQRMKLREFKLKK